jgi:hypothetical protein
MRSQSVVRRVKPVSPKLGVRRAWRSDAWSRIHAPAMRMVILAFCTAEERAHPGQTRSHWRRVRFAAIADYERRFGPVPSALRARRVAVELGFFDTVEYKSWLYSDLL